MKYRYTSLLFSAVLIAVFLFMLSGCMSTAQIQVIEPAAITLPKNIDTIAVVNRFLSNNNYNTTNYSVNAAFGDEHSFNKEASDSCVSSLLQILGHSPRLKDMDIKQELFRTGNDFFAPPLLPAEVTELCRAFKVQGLVVLDGFHTNSSVNTQMNSRQVAYRTSYISNGQTFYQTNYRTEYYYTATMQVFYSIGYRLYHGADGSIIDEYRFDDHLSYSNTASTSYGATSLLPNKRRVIAKIASHSGDVYAHRIAPMWMTVKRSYYSKPGKPLATAHEYVNKKNWNEAKVTWLNLYNTTGSPSTKGLAAYNLAVACEMNDDLDSAMTWVNEARAIFVQKGISDHVVTTDKYISILNSRMAIREKLIEQMAK
jgi:hypothetical protein